MNFNAILEQDVPITRQIILFIRVVLGPVRSCPVAILQTQSRYHSKHLHLHLMISCS